MPASFLFQPKSWLMETVHTGMLTRAQYSRHVPSSSVPVHAWHSGLQERRGCVRPGGSVAAVKPLHPPVCGSESTGRYRKRATHSSRGWEQRAGRQKGW